MSSRKYKIVQIVPNLNYGDGIGNDVVAIHKYLLKHGYEAVIYAQRIDSRLESDTIKLLSDSNNFQDNDILIYHYSNCSKFMERVLRKCVCRKIMVYHNITPGSFFKKHNPKFAKILNDRRKELRKVRDIFDYCIADSEYNKQDLLKEGYTCPIEIVPILVSFEDYNQLPDEELIKKYQGDGVTNVLFVGRIVPNKKQEDIIETFAYYHAHLNPDSRLIIVGNEEMGGEYFSELTSYVKTLGIEESTVFTGHVSFPELLAYYRVADVFLCMSEHEGFCIPLLEAMVFAVPILAYRAAAVPETIGDAGVITDVKDPVIVAEMLNRLVSNKPLREDLKQRMQRRLKEFSYQKTTEKFEKYLTAFINEEEKLVNDRQKSLLVSVIIPVYNVEHYLERCLDSVIEQTLPNIEIICVDDGSKDKSGVILDNYAKLDSRIIVIHKENGGISSARNVALERVRGTYVYFLDSDDWIEPDTLMECVLQMDEDIDIVIFGSQVEDEGGFNEIEKEEMKGLEKKISHRFSGKFSIDDKFIPKISVVIWDKLFRYEIIKKNGLRFVDHCLCEDIPFTREYLICSRNCYFIKKRFYHYIQHAGTITRSKMLINDKFLCFDYLYDRIKCLGLLCRFRRTVSRAYHICVNSTYQNMSFSECNNAKKLATELAYKYDLTYFTHEEAEYLKQIKNRQYGLIRAFERDVLIILDTALANIEGVCNTIKSILGQSYKRPKIVLHITGVKSISEEALPDEFKKFVNQYLYIRFGEQFNLKEELQSNAECVVLTAKSGVEYPKNWLHCVMAAYSDNKEAYERFQVGCVEELDNETLFRDFAIIEVDPVGKVNVYKSKKLIVSMTSYPARINSAALALATIFSQTKLPDEVILWLTEAQFPNREKDLPEPLLQLVKDRHLLIRWCKDDLKPHKKYFYAFQKYPDALVITVDDDILYRHRLIEDLYLSYLLHPQSVSAAGAYLIAILKPADIMPFNSWPKDIDVYIGKPSMQLLAVGGNGVLYPTRLFSQVMELLDKEVIKRICLYNDDLWLKFMELAAEVPVVVSNPFYNVFYISHSQDTALAKENVSIDNRTDRELMQVQKEFDYRYGKNSFCQKLLYPSVGENLLKEDYLYDLIEQRRKQNDLIKKQYEKYSTLRMDIRNRGDEGCDVIARDVNPLPLLERKPKWLPDGITVESVARRMSVDVQCKGDGELEVRLLGQDVRNEDGKRYPVWIDCTFFAVNGEVIFSGTKTVCHDKKYVYRKPVVDGEIVKLEVVWSECQSSNVLDEYRQLQAKLKNSKNKTNQLQMELKNLNYKTDQLQKANAKTLKNLNETQRKAAKLVKELQSVKNGWSYKIGRMVTWVPRIIKDCFMK